MTQRAGQIGTGFIVPRKASATLAAATILLAILAALILGTVSCAGILTKGDNVIVGDSLAARLYFQDRVDHLCPHDGAKYLVPNEADAAQCAAAAANLNLWSHANDVATKVIAEGALPAQERAELKGYVTAAEKLSP